LASPTSWGIYCSLGITLTASCNATPPGAACPEAGPATHCLASRLSTCGWKPPRAHNSCILHACKTSIMWISPRSAASSSSIWGAEPRKMLP
jgi:hypothetical protein